jgi:hypothetical protein
MTPPQKRNHNVAKNVTLPRSSHAVRPTPTRVRQIPLPNFLFWLIVVLLCSMLTKAVAAQDDEAYALSLPSLYPQDQPIVRQSAHRFPAGTFFRIYVFSSVVWLLQFRATSLGH